MKKKLLAALMCTLLTVAVAVPVSAEETTLLDATVTSTYTLTIPATTEIAFNATSTNLDGMLKVVGNVDVGQYVTVTATANPLHNDTHNADIAYTLKNGTTAFSTTNWSETELRADSPKEIRLKVDIEQAEWDAAKAGYYYGSITFAAALDGNID